MAYKVKVKKDKDRDERDRERGRRRLIRYITAKSQQDVNGRGGGDEGLS